MKKRKMNPGDCVPCEGLGQIIVSQGQGFVLETCPTCKGSRKVSEAK